MLGRGFDPTKKNNTLIEHLSWGSGVLYMVKRCWRDILGNVYILLKNNEFRGVRYLKCQKMMKTHPNNIIWSLINKHPQQLRKIVTVTTFCSKNAPKMFGNAPKCWISWKSADICLKNVRFCEIYQKTVAIAHKAGLELSKNACARSEVGRSSEELASQKMSARSTKIVHYL